MTKRNGKSKGNCKSGCSKTNQIVHYSVIIGAVVSFILIVIHFLSGSGNNTLQEAHGPHHLYLFHSKQCGHCQNMMPEWNKLEKENETNMDIRNFEVGDTSQDARNNFAKYKSEISGYPTIIYVDESTGEHEQYTGERTKDAMYSYCKSKL